MSRCLSCNGSKIMMGGGMIKISCDQCGGTGKKIEIKVDKRSKAYKKAKAEIKALSDTITDKEAEDMLDDKIGHVV